MEHQKIDDVNSCDFVNSGNMKFFDILKLQKDFICVPPCDWNNQESYLKCNNMLQKIRVVNDVAERGVALIQNYLHILTKDEEQMQCLLKVVNDHRV